MEKLMLSADGDIILYEVEKQILNDFDDLIEQFFQWKKVNCYDEQLFVKFLRLRYGNKAIRCIKNLGYFVHDNVPKEYENIKWYELIQQYVDGESIYIPRKPPHRQAWGAGTQIKQDLLRRDRQIYEDYLAGGNTEELACKYYLSEKAYSVS